MNIVVNTAGNCGNHRASFNCPHCRNRAVFEPVGGLQDIQVNSENIRVGHRVCPNPDCRSHVFIVLKGGDLLRTYPPCRIEFDTNNIPPGIVETLEEALTCEANECYAASAIMLRRALEEICADQNAKGGNLKARIQDLSLKIVVPDELKDALDELRLLGNGAAHVEAKEYDSVSKEELAVAVEFTKEILKAIYQYKSLLARMIGLKKKPNEP